MGIESNVVRTLVTSLEDADATIHQKSLASLILSTTNCATQTGIILERWKEATDIMLQKKENINNIDKIKYIRLLEGAKTFALKHVAKTAMR